MIKGRSLTSRNNTTARTHTPWSISGINVTTLTDGTITYTVTGFQVFSLPCEVTGIRAIFSTREDTHLGGFPPANSIVGDTTFPVVYHLRQ